MAGGAARFRLDFRPMPRHSSHILEMARKGAEHRYTELKEEIVRLVKTFPHLAGRGAGAASTASSADESPRKRRRMSAKARAAISAAQKARWAKQKAGEKKK